MRVTSYIRVCICLVLPQLLESLLLEDFQGRIHGDLAMINVDQETNEFSFLIVAETAKSKTRSWLGQDYINLGLSTKRSLGGCERGPLDCRLVDCSACIGHGRFFVSFRFALVRPDLETLLALDGQSATRSTWEKKKGRPLDRGIYRPLYVLSLASWLRLALRIKREKEILSCFCAFEGLMTFLGDLLQ